MMRSDPIANKFHRLSIRALEDGKKNEGALRFYDCIKSIEAGASKISSWSLSVLGGSLLAVLSKSYLHPDNSKLKLIYLLFILGWILLGISLYHAKEILGSSIAADLYKGNKEKLMPIFSKCNSRYEKQLRFFNLALFVFGIWLMIYICWWIFGEELIKLLNL